MRIRSQLFLLASCVLVPGVIGAGVAIIKVMDEARVASLRGLQESVRATALLVDGQLQRSIGALTALGNSTALRSGDLAAFYEEAKGANDPPDVWTLLLDQRGSQLLNTAVPFGTPAPPAAATERVAMARSTGKPYVSDLIVGPVTRKLITTMYVPVPAPSQLVLAQAFSVDHWRKTALVPPHQQGWVVGVLDRQGKFISRNQRADELLGQRARPELVAAAAGAQEGVVRHRTLEGVDVYDAFAHSPTTGWTTAIAAPVDAIEASSMRAAAPLAIGLLAAVIAGTAAATYLARTLLLALDRASSSARALGEGKTPPPLTSSFSEFDALERSLSDAGSILAREREARVGAEAERARLLQAETAAREMAEHQNLAKDRFLAMLGHELRNPLAAIAGATEVLAARSRDERDSKFVAMVQRQNRHLAHIVDDLLDMSRMISGKVSLQAQPLDLGDSVRSCVEALRMTDRAQGYEIVADAEDVWIHGDPVRIEQVINNLLTNAIKFSPEGSVVTVTLTSSQGKAVLSVADRGLGIPADFAPHIFEPFIQGPALPGRMPSGMGIGLALVKQIVELHGGSVEVLPNPHAPGSTFRVSLPQIASPPGRPPVKTQTAQPRFRVLLVEDNDDAREATAELLRIEGIDVVEARDGDEMFTALTTFKPDIVIMDLGLPGRDGYALAQELRRRSEYARLPLIALTGYGQGKDRETTKSRGFDEHVVKPASVEELLRAIAKTSPK